MFERISLCLPLLFTLTLACDGGDETVEPRAAEEPDDVAECDRQADHHGKHGKHGKHGEMMVEHLCGEITCTDDQREAIGELLAQAKPPHGPEGDEREAHHEALADAFRADTFDVAALPQPSAEQHAGHITDMATMIVGLHDLLTPEQRETMAAKIEGEGPIGLFGGGRGGRHGKHHGEGGPDEIEHADKPDPAVHAERKVERLCELVTCTTAQVEQLETIFTDALAQFSPPEPPKVDDAVKARFAAAFRADALALADVEPLLAAARPGKPPKHEQIGKLLAAVHEVLTPEQRELVADKIAEHGPHALMGGKGPHGSKGKHGGKGGKGKHGKGKHDANQPA